MFLFCIIGNIDAQESKKAKEGDFIRIEMKDGKSYKGTVKSISSKEISMMIEGTGTVNIDRSNVDEIVIYDLNSSAKVFDYDNPLYSKYYLGESAIGLKKGEGHYQNILIVGNFFSYGFSDNFSVTGGFESASLFGGRFPVLFINPKFTLHNANDKLHFGVGSFTSLYIDGSDNLLFGAAYTNVTLGDKNNNVTMGVGLPWAKDGGIANLPIFQIAGMGRLTNRIGIVGEIFIANPDFADNSLTFGTLNLRFMTKQAVFDVGLFAAREGEFPFPVASAALIF